MRKKTLVLLLAGTLLLFASCSGTQAPRETKAAKESIEQITEEAMDFACDALFFGDSITADSSFEDYFPELRIVNLGVYGDTLEDLLRRVSEVRAADPERIFLLGGINCLRPDNVELCLEQYAALLEALKEACPRARICVESVLPVGAELDRGGAENDAVRRFNAALEPLAREQGCDFADLYAVYEKDGALDPALTRDGIHLNFNAYDPWAETITPMLNP